METCQDSLRNGSAYRVTLGLTVKGQGGLLPADHVQQDSFVSQEPPTLRHQTTGQASFALLVSFALWGPPHPNHVPKEHSVSSMGLWRMLSVTNAVLAFTAQRLAFLRFLDPACLVSSALRVPGLPLRRQMYLEAFVQEATTAQRAALSPHPAQLGLTRMKLEEKAETTANHALLAGSRIYQARRSVIPALLGTTATLSISAPPGGAPLERPALCHARLATPVLGRVQSISPYRAPEALTAPDRVSLPQASA
ncbi:uncharacterized protein LOC115400687 [Salarias fasciatus]|uniref:uncharacterized protein LOC115400687 n=1 Tax=Salarias fasciatus TaxID=181472 RepID=UPI001176DC4C|nr:uncharacterized protein LOC115400687 [Salarias fasciatus]